MALHRLELGPVALPIKRSKLFARDLAAGSLLDSDAVSGIKAFVAGEPIVHLHGACTDRIR